MNPVEQWLQGKSVAVSALRLGWLGALGNIPHGVGA